MSEDNKSTAMAVRKRQQIAKANRTMFSSVAIASVVVGFAVVLILFLAQKIIFTQSVIDAQNNTVSVLKDNIAAVDKLKDNVRVLNTNTSLREAALNDDDPAIQTVLDALPSDRNSTAMASSLQMKLLSGVKGVVIQSLRVDSSDDTESSSGNGNAITFSFTISASQGNYKGLEDVLSQIERSIRPFNILSMSVESQGKDLVLSATGEGYYEPAVTVGVHNKVMRP